ncbi:MAG: hypothetical protein GY801_18110, partial [bacterium]|nr:hypothetical protein [bacterium]
MSGIHSYQSYVKHRSLLMKGIDEKLYTAAMMARATLPKEYHDRIVDSASVSQEAFDELVDRYNTLCRGLGLESLWSLMNVNGKIVFTSSTSPDKNAVNQQHVKFFEVHSNPETYTAVFSTQEPQYQIKSDKWGRIKGVLIPFTDSHGRPYLFGAGMKLSDVDILLNQSLRESLFLNLGFLCIGGVFSYIFAKVLSKPFDD